jgi:hypothetical protein
MQPAGESCARKCKEKKGKKLAFRGGQGAGHHSEYGETVAASRGRAGTKGAQHGHPPKQHLASTQNSKTGDPTRGYRG